VWFANVLFCALDVHFSFLFLSSKLSAVYVALTLGGNGQGYGFRAGFNSTFPVSEPLPIANITNISLCTVCPTEAKPELPLVFPSKHLAFRSCKPL